MLAYDIYAVIKPEKRCAAIVRNRETRSVDSIGDKAAELLEELDDTLVHFSN